MRELKQIAKEFRQFASRGRVYQSLIKAAQEVARKQTCRDVIYRGEAYNPDIDMGDVWDTRMSGWGIILSREDRNFKALCDRFREAFREARPRARDREVESALDDVIWDHLFDEIEVLEGELFEDIYDEIRQGCWEEEELSRDPHAYFGVSPRDFMGSVSKRSKLAKRVARLHLK